MKVEFSTREYESSHMRKPKGRGAWAFAPNGSDDPQDWVFSPSMTLTEAKQWVKAQRPDVDFFSVLP